MKSSVNRDNSEQCGGKIFGCKCLESSEACAVNQLNNSSEHYKNMTASSVTQIGDIHKNNLNKPSFASIKQLNIPHHSEERSSKLTDVTMFLKRQRSKRKLIITSVLVMVLFIIASSLPFIVEKLNNPQPSFTETSPISSIYSLYNRVHHSQHQQVNQDLSQVFISVKTTSEYHYPRLVILLETWISLVKDSVWIFTDGEVDQVLMKRVGDHLVVTNCSSSHHR